MIFNAFKTHCILIPSKTKKYWFKKRLYDSKEREKRDFMLCPKNRAIFYDLNSG